MFLAALVFASLVWAQGQDLNRTIVGCADLDCPASTANTTNDNCTVTDQSFSYVGFTRIPTTQESLKGISWTQGFGVVDHPINSTRVFHSSFFLGAPPDLDLSKTGGCSVFLHGISYSLSFGGNDGKNETAQGTCAAAMGTDCVDALVDRARAFFQSSESKALDVPDRCSALSDHLHKNMDKQCAGVAKGSWTDLSSTALTGNASPEPISTQDNSTSTCWPVLPKENKLTHVTDYLALSDISAKDTIAVDTQSALVAITPILTVFYPIEKDSIVENVDASLSCIKIVGPPRASISTISTTSTMSTMSPGTDEGLAVPLSSSSTILLAMGSLLTIFCIGF
ncbi:hypothetical protein F4808DRAFT_130563 [Astrocystis sublimbata]|nr:hypothetical protein F4808DRAFT_130563 [Astrocystis sublimbata]